MVSVTTFYRDDRYGHAILLTFLYRVPAIDHQGVPGALEITDVVRVVDNAHLVGFIVPDRERSLGIYHNKNVNT